jgi:hypothetical protein
MGSKTTLRNQNRPTRQEQQAGKTGLQDHSYPSESSSAAGCAGATEEWTTERAQDGTEYAARLKHARRAVSQSLTSQTMAL